MKARPVTGKEWVKHTWDVQPDASAGTKAVWLALARFASDDGLTYPGVETIAKRLNVRGRTVQRALRYLEDNGWIVAADRRGGKGNAGRYYLVFRQEQMDLDEETPKGDILGPQRVTFSDPKGDISEAQRVTFSDPKGDISEAQRVTLLTPKGDIANAPSNAFKVLNQVQVLNQVLNNGARASAPPSQKPTEMPLRGNPLEDPEVLGLVDRLVLVTPFAVRRRLLAKGITDPQRVAALAAAQLEAEDRGVGLLAVLPALRAEVEAQVQKLAPGELHFEGSVEKYFGDQNWRAAPRSAGGRGPAPSRSGIVHDAGTPGYTERVMAECGQPLVDPKLREWMRKRGWDMDKGEPIAPEVVNG